MFPEQLIADVAFAFTCGVFLYMQQMLLDVFLKVGGLIFLEVTVQQMFELHRLFRVLPCPGP